MVTKIKKPPFVWASGKLTHRDAKGSKIRYRLDKICRESTIQELDILLEKYDKRVKNEKDPQKRREYRTCCKIIRDWKHLKETTDAIATAPYWDPQKGVVIGENIYTIEYSEDGKEIIIRDEEGNIIDRRPLE